MGLPFGPWPRRKQPAAVPGSEAGPRPGAGRHHNGIHPGERHNGTQSAQNFTPSSCFLCLHSVHGCLQRLVRGRWTEVIDAYDGLEELCQLHPRNARSCDAPLDRRHGNRGGALDHSGTRRGRVGRTHASRRLRDRPGGYQDVGFFEPLGTAGQPDAFQQLWPLWGEIRDRFGESARQWARCIGTGLQYSPDRRRRARRDTGPGSGTAFTVSAA